MPKKANKSKRKVGTAGKRERRTTRGKTFQVHAEDHIDGCACEFIDSEATPDAALPPAKGGVASVGRARRGS
jgi:hypothetical protein